MNHNFLGTPSREDIQALEVLRNRLMPMIGLLDKVHADMQLALYRGEATSNPDIMRMYNKATAQLASVNAYLNGSYKHREEPYRDANGRPVLDAQGNARMRYTDAAHEGAAERIEALHVFPQAPFPMDKPHLAAMAEVLLNKRLNPPEEKWVEDRLRKAAEFAYVPGEWGIEAKKPAAETREHGDDDDDDDDDDSTGDVADISTKRFKGTLNEDQIVDLWTKGHKTAFDKQYQAAMRFEQRAGGMDDEGGEKDMEGVGQTPEDEEEMEDEEDEEDEFEEVDMSAPAAPVVMIQRAPPSVHKPVPGTPIMPLGMVHRFMTLGEVVQR
ncbi:mediator of RNA polymerase II transcription subunit 8 [Pleosporales sp. CAS-2024a]